MPGDGSRDCWSNYRGQIRRNGEASFVWESWLGGQCTGIPDTGAKFNFYADVCLSHFLFIAFRLCNSICIYIFTSILHVGSVRNVVIDCAPISFLDAVGVKALKQLVLDFDKCDVQVLFAAMTGK